MIDNKEKESRGCPWRVPLSAAGAALLILAAGLTVSCPNPTNNGSGDDDPTMTKTARLTNFANYLNVKAPNTYINIHPDAADYHAWKDISTIEGTVFDPDEPSDGNGEITVSDMSVTDNTVNGKWVNTNNTYNDFEAVMKENGTDNWTILSLDLENDDTDEID